MDHALEALLLEGLFALGLGLFIGLEREHRDIETPHKGETVLGVRTFSLVAVTGWVCAILDMPWLSVAALLALGALLAVGHVRDAVEARGLTSEVAAITTFLLGILVHHQRSLAVALGLATMLLLLSKPWFVAWVPRLRRMDLIATLQLLIVLAIGLPLLPRDPIDPWGVLPPRRIGLFVTLIAGISYVGYVLNRTLSPERGAGLTGLVGGLASSTAVTAAMAQQVRAAESMREPAQLAIFLANTVMVLRVLVITAVVSRPVAMTLAIPLGAMALVKLGGSLWTWRRMRRAPRDGKPASVELKNPFSLWPAVKWGAFLAAVLLVAEGARRAFGTAGLIASAAASGLADVDAITVAMAQRAANQQLDQAVAALAITVAILSNTVVKTVIAWVSGGRALGLRVAIVLAIACVAGLSGAGAVYLVTHP